MTETEYSWAHRVSRAGVTLVFNAFLWLLIPSLLSNLLAGALPSSPIAIGLPFVYAFGITITALQVLGSLTQGMAVSVPVNAGSYIAEAYYIWAAVDGGVISLKAAGLGVALSFQPLLFLLMLPPLFNAVKAPVDYLLEQSDAARPASDQI